MFKSLRCLRHEFTHSQLLAPRCLLLQTFIGSWVLSPGFLGAIGLKKRSINDLGLLSSPLFAEAIGYAGLSRKPNE